MGNGNSAFFSLFSLPFLLLPVVVIVYGLKSHSQESQRADDLQESSYESEEEQDLQKRKPFLHRMWTDLETSSNKDTRSVSAELDPRETQPISLALLVDDSYLVAVFIYVFSFLSNGGDEVPEVKDSGITGPNGMPSALRAGN
ncbi:hypothetical protein CPB86DRAFT_825903 [Serendipita vermifera]|nr:hypothetical protein CPB86DRAFT_825903 [Serendipita vermifera]